MGVVIGYAKVSTDGQSVHDQIVELKAAGASRMLAEKLSGAHSDRPMLRKALAALDEGDTLMVVRLDRLARSTRDLLNILHESRRQGRVVQEPARLLGRHHHAAWPFDAHHLGRSGPSSSAA
jgi:DNA invertase Pin-like site-specific DNA recombinase